MERCEPKGIRIEWKKVVGKTQKKTDKQTNKAIDVTPTYGSFRHSTLDKVVGSTKRIFLFEGVVQGQSKTRHLHANVKPQKNAKKGESLIQP